MAKAWSTFLPDVMPHVPGCPVAVAEHYVRRAAQAFFDRSKAWSVLTASMAVAADQAEVTVVLPDAGTELVRVEQAWLDGRTVVPATARDLDETEENWTQQAGTVTRVVMLTPGVVRLFRIPEAAATTGLRLRASVRPSEAATGVPDDIAVQYRDSLIMGAKGMLMTVPKKPWSSELGAAMLTAFEAAADAAQFSAVVRGGSVARRPARVSWC